ncbi:MAG: amidohydrolase [Deltaproteobacteria bacterium SG8_13]|nr:MAG: amidohydrolase [Deltaproteobacteria bacterium SG8_13]
MSTASHRIDEQAPRLAAPPGACDTHIHFYGPPEAYPLATTATFTPPLATVEAYRQVQQRLGLQRVVVVQPSGYGFDNRCTLDAAKQLGDEARAVVVVGPAVTDGELQQLTDEGVRAVRFFMFPGGVLDWKDLDHMAGRVHEFGWHVQLQLDGRQLPDRIEQLRRLPGMLQIDHTGKFVEPVSTGDPAFRMLLNLVDGGRCWVKLAAPYETSQSGPPHYGDVGELARALVKASPERMLWASNWPHPSAQDNPPDNAMLLDLLLDWAEDDTTRKRILVDNPAQLYGFG